MVIPALALKYYTGTLDLIFLRCAGLSMFIGGLMFLANFGKIKSISIMQGYLITVVCWFSALLFAAMPLYGNGDIVTIHDALFEAASGITTTGATILNNVEAQPKSVLLWRAMINGLGGIGIVIFAVALMPFLGIGGMHIFNKENSDTEDKFLPKIRYIAKDIIIAYVLLNIACAVFLKWAGMNWFDAVAHALSTLCTGGFSTKNSSVGTFDSPLIEVIISVFMLFGAMPLTFFVILAKKKTLTSLFSNPQVNIFLRNVFIIILSVSGFYAYTKDVAFLRALREVSFNVISAITTTGFTSCNFLAWGPWTVILFVMLAMHSGCTGSTSGSIKVYRWHVVWEFFKKNLTKSLSPNQVVVMKIGDKIIDDDTVSSVFVLVISFICMTFFAAALVSLTGEDFTTSVGAIAVTITSFGSGLTDATGPLGNFAGFTPFAKFVITMAMMLGRLEIVTVLVLLRKIKFF